MTDASFPELIFRVVVSLGVVLALMAAAAAVLRRSGLAGGGGGRGRRGAPRVEVLTRQALSRGAAVTVVQLGERGLVLGVTESHVSLLAEVDPAAVMDTPEVPGMVPGGGPLSSPAWKTALDALRERTVRPSRPF